MESTNRTQINPWLQIWSSPKKTLRSILEKDPKRFILWLAIVGGIISGLSWLGYLWFNYPYHLAYKNTFFIVAMLIAGGIFGVINLYFGGWLYRLTGSWVGGTGSYTDVKCAVGWSWYPFIIAGILGVLSVLASNLWIQFALGVLNLIFGFWGFVIFLNLLGEAHRFSAWKALLAFLIALVLLFVALMIVSLLVPLLRPLFD